MRVSCSLALLVAACTPPHGAGGPPVTASGQAFVFGSNSGSLAGATVHVVEAPGLHTTIDAAATFSLQVPSGGECSFAIEQPDRLTAHKTGKQFTPVKLRCSAGVLVNAAPPWGLQTL